MPPAIISISLIKGKRYLKDCLDSLSEQNLKDEELIIIINGNNEDINDLIENYQLNIIKKEFNNEITVGKARNEGLKIATGKYIYFIDSDDYVDPRIVELCVNEALKKDADIVSVARSFVYADFTRVMRIPEINSPEEWRKSLISGRTQHSVWGNLILKKLYTENGILAIEGLHQGEDFAVMPRLAYYSKNHSVVNIPLYYYLVRTDIYQFKEQTIKDTFESWRVVNEFYKTKTDYCLYKEELDKRIQTFLSWQIVSWQSSGKGVTGAELLIKNTFPKADFRIVNDNRKKIVLFLFDKGFYKTLSIFIKFSSQIQRLMGRRGKNV